MADDDLVVIAPYCQEEGMEISNSVKKRELLELYKD